MEAGEVVGDRPPRVLAFVDFYLPGYKAGGPVRTIRNMTEALSDRIDFRLITSDRDLGDAQPYPGVARGVWQPVGSALVCYLEPRQQRPFSLRAVSGTVPYDVLYLNSAFSPLSTIPVLLLRRLGLWRRVPVLLAPRGEFSPGALEIKAGKKRYFLQFARWLGLYRGVVWHASSDLEREDIHRVIGPRARVEVALDCPEQVKFSPTSPEGERPEKRPGTLRLVFLSRITPKKNLLGAVELIRHLDADVTLDIYGPIEDQAYWADCENAISTLPDHVRAYYRGSVAPENVRSMLARYDAFLFPTRGENFGHVIYEALIAGCPVVISDRTPWRDLEPHSAGWSLPLEQPAAFVRVLERLAAMDEADHRRWALGAARRGLEVMTDTAVTDANLRMFHALAQTNR